MALSLIFIVIVYSFGFYFKKQSDEYERKYGKSTFKCYDYMKLRFDHPHIYSFLIDHHIRRLVRGKKIEQYQKDVLIDFLMWLKEDVNEEEMHFTRYDLQDEELLKMQFNQERYMPLGQKIKRKLLQRKNKKEKEKNNMFDDDDTFIYRHDMSNLMRLKDFDDYDSFNNRGNKRRGNTSRSYIKIM